MPVPKGKRGRDVGIALHPGVRKGGVGRREDR